jgi:hypothetical protein
MAFRLAPLNIPNLSTDYSAEINAAGALGKTIASLPDTIRKRQQEAELQTLGAGIANGTIDPAKAAGRFFALGQAETGLGLMKLGEAQKLRTLGQEATQGLATALGGGTPYLGAPVAPVAPSAGQPGDDPRSKASLISNESGGRWDAQNDATGAGGMKGHFGRIQFGQARLQEAAASGAIPPGTTPQAFMQSPELQRAAEKWHWDDIDQTIAANGYDRLVGQPINGVPVTIEGLRAVAHLGGKDGMRRFVETGGQYNPSDANGTRLMDYFARHGGGRTRTAGADMPAPGARPASMESGQEGFAVPGAPAMSGRTFDAITGGAPLDPVFQSEGASQPWMGSALQGQPAQARPAAIARQTLPPARPYDAGSALPGPADMPAPGAVPAVGRFAQPEDLSNSSDAGSRTFAASQAAPAVTLGAAPFLPPRPGPQPVAANTLPQSGPAPSIPQPNPSAAARPAPQGAPSDFGAPVAPIAGDDPATLRRDAAAYAQSNPEAARQLNARADAAERAQRADMPAQGATETQAQAPRLSQELPRPTNAQEARDYRATRQMEESRGKAASIAAALANPNLPANARAVGEIFLKEALEQSRAPDSVKEFQYARAMGWTTAKSPNEYAKEKSGGDATPAIKEYEYAKRNGFNGSLLDYEREKAASKAKPGISASDQKAIFAAEDQIPLFDNSIETLKRAKELNSQTYTGTTAGFWGAVGTSGLPGAGLVTDPQKAKATREFGQIMSMESIKSMSDLLKGATTDREMANFQSLLADPSTPPEIRARTIDRMLTLVERQKGIAAGRIDELRSKAGIASPRQPAQGGPQATPQGAPQGAPQRQAAPDLSQAKRAPDGNLYIPDPSRPGKYLMVQP